jgi:peptide chain release factor 1
MFAVASASAPTVLRRILIVQQQLVKNVRLPRRRTIVSVAVQRRIDQLLERHAQLLKELEHNHNAASGKELSSLSKIVALIHHKQTLQTEQTSWEELSRDAMETNDLQLQQECSSELETLLVKQHSIDEAILQALLPNDDDDTIQSDAIIEVRAGTGGDEASLFAFELLQSYIKTAKAMQWKTEVLGEQKTEIGGIREAALSVSGSASAIDSAPVMETTIPVINDNILFGPYGLFQWESGVHRVQRVPVNDSRIHTSACSVGVLPSLTSNDQDYALPPSELKIETMRSSGAGGQHVNTTDSAVRITHLPTGLQASIQDERSQHKNKEKALKLLTARVRDQERLQEIQERGQLRSQLMGGGDRSERIRTYNFAQDRVTDHRSKMTRHGIETLLNGTLQDGLVTTFLPELRRLQREELIQALEEDTK